MMGCLYRISGENNDPEAVWITRDMLDQAVEASPSLKTIAPELRERWTAWSDASRGEVIGDLPQWVIREGMTDAGYYQDAKSTEEFCRNVFPNCRQRLKTARL